MGGVHSVSHWLFTGWVYVPSAATGQQYLILLNQYTANGTQNWSTEVLFDADVNEVQDVDGPSTLRLIRDRWVEVTVDINLALDRQAVMYDGEVLFTDAWTSHVADGGTPTIAAVDLFSNAGTSVYWDDLSLQEVTGPVTQPLTLSGGPDLNPTGDILLDTNSAGPTFVAGSAVPDGVGPIVYRVFQYNNITIGPGITVRATGDRPCILAANGTVNVQGTIQVDRRDRRERKRWR